MRRPLKPFVTEYKGSRRNTPPFGETASSDFERSAPKIVETSFGPDTDADDSYDAAMRAADALFAPSSASKPRIDQQGNLDLAQRTGDAEQSASVRAGGRILQAIDETPPPQFAAREAEFAPRRRGRKPGSKNRPKITGPAPVEADIVAAPIAPAMAVASAEPASNSVPRMAALVAGAAPPRAGKKFPWVRDRLKPGENWKRRRLPKVCW